MTSETRGIFSEELRGQSETIGFILLFAMVLIGAGAIISYGAVAVNDSEESLSADRAEKVMTQMDSEISMVALGQTDSQRMKFDRVSGEQYSIDGEAGTINISTIGDDPRVIMPDTTLGAIKFERGDTVIAYQGGGVWRSDGRGSGMISPPEFNYRDQTLTLPLVTVSGDRSLSRGAVIRKNGDSVRHFPNATRNLRNPLEDDEVQVTIESEFHDGWRTYFETRTEGDVVHEPENQRVKVNLTAPIVENFDGGVKTTGGGTTVNGNGANSAELENVQSGTAVSANSTIENKITECQTGSDCTDLTASETGDGGTLTDGTYYSGDNTDVTFDSKTTFDTAGGDIDIVVDGSLEFAGSGNSPDHEIIGDGEVTVYVRENFDVSGSTRVNTDGDADDLLTLVHEDGDVDINGNAQYTGLIYAPDSDFSINGGGNCGAGTDCRNVVGGVVAHSATAKGNGYLEYEPTDRLLQLEGGVDTLTFLHVSTNPVVVTET